MTSHTGTKYEATQNLRTAEIAKLFRADVKAAIASGELPAGLKLSVKTRTFAGGSSIDVAVTALPAGALVLNPARVAADLAGQTTYGIDRHTAESGALLAKIEGMLEAYNYSENDWQSDYSRCRFYGDVKIAGEIEQAERAAHEQLAAMGDVRAILGDAAQLGVLSVNMVETRDVMDWRGREVLIPATVVAETAIRVLRAERAMLDAAS